MKLDPWLYSRLLAEAGRTPEDWLQTVTFVLTRIAESIGALVIAVGVGRGLIVWVAQHLPGNRDRVPTESIRLGLGRSLGLALEFLLAADILSTAVAPSWDAIGKLAAIATIRTLLNYFLGQELKQEERRRQLEPSPAFKTEDTTRPEQGNVVTRRTP
jgi:uncharacterized membrane protein